MNRRNRQEQLEQEGFEVRTEDIARLSPLVYDHINVLGPYAFSLRKPPAEANYAPCGTRPKSTRKSLESFLMRLFCCRSSPALQKPGSRSSSLLQVPKPKSTFSLQRSATGTSRSM
jgi:hypothetical protein